MIRKEFATLVNSAYNKPVFWSGAYFVASSSGTTLEQLQAYVENQKSPEYGNF